MQVIGIGDNVVDKYINLNKMFPGGNALNFSVYAKKQGINSAYIGIFGNDKAANHINNILSKLNIDTSHCRYYDGENAYAEVSLKNGDRKFIGTNKGGIASQHPLKLSATDLEYIKSFNLIHTSCYSNIESELIKLNELEIPISFDFSENFQKEYLKKVCPYITFSFFSCANLSEKESIQILKNAVKHGSLFAVATRGEKGALLLYHDKLYYQEAKNINPKDTLGAGDAFITGFLLELLQSKFNYSDKKIESSLETGVEYAAKYCKVNGAFGEGKKI